MKKNILLSACAVAAFTMSQVAIAAPQAGGADEASEAADGEIVVTATRRDTSIQSAPISISALSADTLITRGIRSVDDIAYAVPGLSYTSNNDGTESLSVRGIVAFGSTATTAYYIDETPISQLDGGTFSPRYFDIERVEVLRGPQGTLYGASAMGGAVRVITKKPNLSQFEGAFRAEGSTTKLGKENGLFDGAVSIPIINDRLALRITGFYENQSGWVKNFKPVLSADPAAYFDAKGAPGVAYSGLISPNGKRVGREEIYGGRAALRAQPSDTITLTGSYSWQQRQNNGFNSADTAVGLGFNGTDFRQARVVDEFRTLRTQLANFTAEADLGIARVISSTSYEWGTDNALRDGSSLLLGNIVVGFPLLGIFSQPIVPSNASGQSGVAISSIQSKRSFTQEVRVVSTGDGPFNWIFGGFYNKAKLRQVQDVPVFGLAAILGEETAPKDSVGGSFVEKPYREISVFGEAGYKFSDTLNATIGVRSYKVRSGASGGATGLISGGVPLNTLKNETDRGLTYKALLNFKPAQDVLLFTSFTTGYRPGGSNPPRLLADNQSPDPYPDGFKSDKLAQYELGWKTRFLDRSLTFNGAIFYIDWKDIPTSATSPSGVGFTFNGPKARTYGGEAEIIMRPTKGLDFSMGFTVLDAKFAADFKRFGVTVKKGDLVPNVPKYAVNAALNYEWSVGANSSAHFNANVAHVSSRRETADLNIVPLPGFVTAGLSAGIAFGKADLSIFVRNVFDERARIGNSAVGNEIAGGALFDQRRLSYIQPRTVGASVQFAF
jgi:iron complex outermembrane recepter protein